MLLLLPALLLLLSLLPPSRLKQPAHPLAYVLSTVRHSGKVSASTLYEIAAELAFQNTYQALLGAFQAHGHIRALRDILKIQYTSTCLEKIAMHVCIYVCIIRMYVCICMYVCMYKYMYTEKSVHKHVSCTKLLCMYVCNTYVYLQSWLSRIPQPVTG